MSADNWTLCPRCIAQRKANIVATRAEADAAYGKVPVEEWLSLNEAAQVAHIEDGKRNFREDYDIGIDNDGQVDINYSGHCNECGFDVQFSHSFTADARAHQETSNDG